MTRLLVSVLLLVISVGILSRKEKLSYLEEKAGVIQLVSLHFGLFGLHFSHFYFLGKQLLPLCECNSFLSSSPRNTWFFVFVYFEHSSSLIANCTRFCETFFFALEFIELAGLQ